jgi:cytochrome c-type biogenesis protein CcmH
MKRLLWLLALCVSAWSVNAQTGAAPREAPLMAQDPQLEARMVQLAQELRCLVCQNESLASSHAELADDLRQEVREQLRQGKSDQEIKDYLVARYGDFVLYRPEVKPLTWVLWFGPFALVLLALVLLVRYIAQRRRLYEQLTKEESAS